MTLTTDPQHMQREKALATANQIRVARAELKHRIAEGQGDVRAVIFEPPRYMLTATLLETLKAVRQVGDVAARKTCKRAEVNPLQQLGKLTDGAHGERNRVLRAMEGVKMFGGRA